MSAVVFCFVAATLSALWLVWVRRAYVDYSEGVYLLAGREVLHGAGLYRTLVAAHPPGIYYTAAAILWVHDSIWAARVALAGVACLQATAVAILTQRVTASRGFAVAIGLTSLVTPWALRGRTWGPEGFVPLLLLTAVILSDRPRTAPVAGVVGALAIFFKLTYGLPALVVVVTSSRPWRASVAFVITAAALLATCFVAYGAAFYRNLVSAQLSVGWVNPLGSWRLGALETAPLVMVAAVGASVGLARDDKRLVRTIAVAAAASLALTVTTVKVGTGLVNLAVFEPLSLPLVAIAVQRVKTAALPNRRALLVALVGATVWTLGQSLSLVLTPLHPVLSNRGNSWELTDNQVAAAVNRARACDPGLAYSGDPYIALLAGRRLPGHQTDPSMLGTPVHRDELLRAEQDRPTCP